MQAEIQSIADQLMDQIKEAEKELESIKESIREKKIDIRDLKKSLKSLPGGKKGEK